MARRRTLRAVPAGSALRRPRLVGLLRRLRPLRSGTRRGAEVEDRTDQDGQSRAGRRQAGGATGGGGGGHRAARPRGARRHEHGGQPRRPDGHQRQGRPREVADRQPRGDQQPPAPQAPGEDQLHPPDRLRHGPGHEGHAEHERVLRRGRRQARRGPARRHRARHRDRHGEERRHPATARPEHQERAGHGLRRVPARLRGPHPPGTHRQTRGRRFRRHHREPDQPRHDRHGPLGAEVDARPGGHRRGRRDGVPGRVPRRRRGEHHPAGDQQDPHADLDLRPPDHPGRPERRVPAAHPPVAARRRGLLRQRLPFASYPLRADPLGARHRPAPRRRDLQDRTRAGTDPRLPCARALDGRHRPAGVQAAFAPGPRRVQPRSDAVGPRPRVRHRRFRRRALHATADRSRDSA